jgi:anti-sigma B factor antagonist
VPLLTVAVAPVADRVVVHLAGEADLSTQALLDQGLQDAAAAGDPIEVDLGDVRFFDSSCLGTLGSFSARLSESGRTCRLVGVPPRTRRIIDLAGLGDLLAS